MKKGVSQPYFWVLCLFILWTFVFGSRSQVAIGGADPAGAVQTAWELARTSGQYRYRSLIEQTTYPAPTVTNAGRPPRQDRLAIEGNVNLPTQSLNLTLWDDASFNPQTGLAVKVENGQAYGRRGQGQWQEMDNVADLFAPGGDPLGFLAGATNIQAAPPESRTVGNQTLTFSHYTFLMDGPAFAAYLVQQFADYQSKYGAIPAGLKLAPPASYQRMTGQGDLWLTPAGLPARLTVRIELPDQPQEGQRIAATINNDYHDFNQTPLSQLWWQHSLSQLQTALTNNQLTLQFIPVFLFIALLSLRCWQTRPFYAIVVLTVILAMLLTPLLQGQQVEAYFQRINTEQQAQQEQQTEAEQQEELDTALNHHPTWDPHQSPLAAQSSIVNRQSPIVNAIDSDSDGLSDEDEAYWGTCAYTVGSTGYLNSPDCVGVGNPTDSDDDGLGDGTEINDLNTYPTSPDTDGDTITDTIEITGFSYAGRTWYLDPIRDDSNDDGLVDSGECNLATIADEQSLANACPDTNNDGTPDLFDDDNDGDGVKDGDDLSPAYYSPQTYDNNNPLLVSLSNFTVGEPILLDIQLRPTTNEHLNFYNHILDWPADDQGQIQRHLDTTWANTANTTYQSNDENAANGDIRLVPMLEIIMPYSNGHYANLPVNTAYYGTNRTLGVAVDNWLDTADTEPYAMSIDDLDLATGDLVAYVPLTLQTDENDNPVAYTTRLFYQPSQASWGAAQEYRVVWLVQMLTDQCVNPNDDEDSCTREDTVTVIHTYSEQWALTGLNVSEEQKLDVALLYENPANDDALGYDDQLWIASWNLGNTFLRGRDCDNVVNGSCVGNGQRDVTIANLSGRISSWNLDYTEVDTFSYEHQGFAAHIMMTETVNILNTVFTPYVGQTVPTILIAQEHTSRAFNLDAYEGDIGNGLTLNLASNQVPAQLQASLSWASYDYVNGEWVNYDPEDYLEYLHPKLQSQAYFQPTDSSQEAQDEADGKLLWAQSYYASLYAGAQAVVMVNTTIAWQPSQLISELDLDPIIPVNSGQGASIIAYEFAIVYASKKISVEAAETGIWAYFKRQIQATADDSYQFTRFNKGGLAANRLALVTIMAAIFAIALIAAGLITGNDVYIQVGTVILSIITMIVTAFYIINAIQSIIKAVQGVTGALTIIAKGLAAGRWFQGIGVIGFIIGVLVVWGTIGVLILSKGLKGIALGYAIAYAIASTIVLFVYLILDLIGLGILVYFIILLDALFAIFGAKGPTQLLTEAIADSLYGVYQLIKNLDDSGRLQLDLANMAFGTDDLGFVVQNSFIFTVAVTNTLRYDTHFSFSDLEQKTVFRYYAQGSEIDHHNELTQGEMVGEWVAVDSDEARASDVLAITIPLSSLGSGIAQSLDGWFYITESYIAPYQGCWKFAGIPTDCDWYKFSGSAHINIGQELVYDILPNTLVEFARMKWDSRLPQQVDLDNDGLTAPAGTDPNETVFDSDGDNLSDYYEILYGLNPQAKDPDQDGLTDADEITYGTNPFAADSDSDGLNDYLESKVGWLVVYKNNGQSYLTRVWSDPNTADSDQDTLNDLEEFLFGFHP